MFFLEYKYKSIYLEKFRGMWLALSFVISPLKLCLTFCKSLNRLELLFLLFLQEYWPPTEPRDCRNVPMLRVKVSYSSKEAVWSAVEIAQLTPRNPGSCFVLFVTARGSPISLMLSCPHKAFPTSLTMQCLLITFINPAYVCFIPLSYIKTFLSIFLSCWAFFFKILILYYLTIFLMFLKIDSLWIAHHVPQSNPSPSPST